MRVNGLDGRPANMVLERSLNENPSGLHLRARQLLMKLFPMESRLEEVLVPGTKMRLDFFLPALKLIIEVQGEQHFAQNDFFHENYTDFLKQKIRDRSKGRFADLNHFILVELNHDESDIQWAESIRKALRYGEPVGPAGTPTGSPATE